MYPGNEIIDIWSNIIIIFGNYSYEMYNWQMWYLQKTTAYLDISCKHGSLNNVKFK